MIKQIHSCVLTLSMGAVLVVSALACPTAVAESTSLKITYGFPWIGYGPFYVAQEKGYFKDEDLQVELLHRDLGGPDAEFQALAAGETEGLPITLDVTPLYWKSETPFAVVLAIDDSSGGDGILVRKDLNIDSVKGLKDKTIALRQNTPSHFFLNYLLQQHGLSEADVNISDMSPEEAASAVVAGNVDAAVTWNPPLSEAMKDPNVDLLVTSKETPGLIVDVLLMRKDVLQSKPDACKRLVRAWNKGVDYLTSNPDEAAAFIVKGLDYGTPEAVKADLAGITPYGKERNAEFFSGSGPGTALHTANFAIELWTKLGRVASPVKAEDLIDSSCLEK